MVKFQSKVKFEDGVWHASVWVMDYRQRWVPIAIRRFDSKIDAMKWVSREEATYNE